MLKASAVTGLGLAAATLAAGVATADPKPRPRAWQVGDTAYVDVAVATLWVNAKKDRKVDAPSTTNPVDMRAWTKAMTLKQRHWLVGNLETAALLGQTVTITDVDGAWVKVVVHDQPTPRDPRGYPGWMPSVQLTDKALADGKFAQVKSATTWLYDDSGLGKKFMEISYCTRLPVVDASTTAVKVSTPTDGDKWVATSDVDVYATADDIPKPSGADLVADAKMFLGLPYLWAGVSGFGFDCSGYTHSLYRVHGITIPRDAGDQKDAGTPVNADSLVAGDLLFYGTSYIHHVGMCIGDGKIIDARTNTDTTEQVIEIVPIADHPYADEFAGAVRYLV